MAAARGAPHGALPPTLVRLIPRDQEERDICRALLEGSTRLVSLVGPPGIAWDACGLLNLAASGSGGEILAAQGCASYVVREVLEAEVIYQRPLPEEDPEGRLVPVDLSPLFEADLLTETEPTDEERETALILAQDVDDGARLRFRLYWLVVGPFSAFIRRRWLATAKRRVEHIV